MEYTLDETIDRNSIEARLEKGILTLTLGLSENVKPRKINVVSK
jgi:HSP20 family molecular chaperone IbpA